AIGAILYHVLAGRPPYEGSNSNEVLAAIAKRPPVPVEESQPVPRDLAAIVRKAMARDATQRYDSAKELAEDLRRFQSGQLVSAQSYSPAALLRRWLVRHRRAVAIATGLVLVLGAAASVSLRQIIVARTIAEKQRALAEARSDELRMTHAKTIL